MPMHDWKSQHRGAFHNFRFLWLAQLLNRLNDETLPSGHFAMAERACDGSECEQLSDVYALKANRIAIHHELGEVVAIIELVSPGNIDCRNAIRMFVDKARNLLLKGVNLLVVDPFPPGPRDPQGIHQAIWEQFTDAPFELPPEKPLTIAAYQAMPNLTTYIEPIAVGDPLPVMPLFLDWNLHINVPLEESYQTTWNVLPVELRRLVDLESPRQNG